MDSIIHDVQSLYEVALAQLGDCIQRALCDASVNSDVKESVATELTGGSYTHMFAGLTTVSQQMAYFKQHFNFVVCSFAWFLHTCTCSPHVSVR